MRVIKKSVFSLYTFSLCGFYFCGLFAFSSSARVVDSSTEAGALCIDGPLCVRGGSSSLSRLVGSIPEDSCPKFIIRQQILRDKKSSLTTDSPDEICARKIGNFRSHFKDVGELESYLRRNPFFSELHQKQGTNFSSCLSQRVSVPVGLGKTALALSTKALPESKKKLAVAEYYSSLRRLSDGVERSLQNITAIDIMIGEESLLADISCKSFDPLSREVKSQCSSVKQCSNNKANDQNSSSSKNAVLEESAKDTLLALQGISAIEKEIKRLKGPRARNLRKNKEKIEELEERKRNLQSLYPWIVGKVFQDSYNRNEYSNYSKNSEETKNKMEDQMADLIKDQLTHTREKLKERKEDFIKASACIKGDEDLCDELDMAKVLAKAPPINHGEVFERERKKELKKKSEENNLNSEERKEYRELLTKAGEADGLFELAGCLQTQRKAVKQVNRELALGALDIGIVIGTMGLGSPYVVGRLALRLGSTVSKATQAKNLSKAKRLQYLGIFGTDVSLSTPYMKEAVNVCEDTLNQLEETASTEKTANEETSKMCENLPIRAKQTSDLKSCILQASLASLPITLPILGLSGMAVAKKLRGAKAGSPAPLLNSSAEKAEEVLKTKLSPAQKRAVEEAHLIGQGEKGKDGAIAGIGNYTEAQLRRKAEILRRAGFSQKQRRKLMKAGVVGDDFLRRADEQLAEALQTIRRFPEEPRLKAQGFKSTYYRGLDQAREFNAVARYLRTIKADPKRTHIPYFSDQVETILTDFERSFKQNNPKLFRKKLTLLEALKAEARKRMKDQNVTYDWWTDFNLRLSTIATSTPKLVITKLDLPRTVGRRVIFKGIKKKFPEKVMFFTTDELGIMAFNRLESNSHFVGVSGSSVIADGRKMNAFNFFHHDLAHTDIAKTVPQKVSERIDNISNKADREKAELALFIYRHENSGDYFNNRLMNLINAETNLPGPKLRRRTKKFIRKMMTRNKKRFRNPKDLQGMLPESVNPNNREGVEQFLIESADVFADIVLVR